MTLNFFQISFLILIALAGIPAGYLISKATKEELVPGRKWFKILIGLSLIFSAGSPFLFEGDEMALALTVAAFILLLSATSLKLSYKKF